MKRTTVTSCLCAIAAWAIQFGTPGVLAQAQNATLYEGARLIIGDDSAPIENSAFLVEDGRFTRIGARGQVQLPAGGARVDLTGKTVMPAMVNTHMHLGPGRGEYLRLSPQAQREAYVKDLHQLAYGGLAASTSMGWDLDPVFQVRAESYPNAARILTSGRGASAPLGQKPETIAAHEAGRPSRMDEALSDNTTWIATETQARIYVREQAAKRVDFIKMWVDDRLGTELTLSPKLYQIIIQEAHDQNIPVFTHLFYLRDAKGVIRAGGDMLAHPVRDALIDDEFVQLMKERKAVQQENMAGTWERIVTARDAKSYWEDPLFLEFNSAQAAQRIAERARTTRTEPLIHEGQKDVDGREINGEIYKRIVSNLARLYKEGVRIALGTDGSDVFRAHKALQLLVEDVKLTPLQAITTATRNAAEALRLNNLGTVTLGKDASFIVLNANPLDDITNTRRIGDVYLRGHKVDREMIKRTYLR